MRRRVTCLALLSTGAAALLPAVTGAAGSSGSPAAHAAATRTVVLRDIAFNPSRVTIHRGDRVTWQWRDGRTRHNVTSRSFRSASTRSSGSYSVTFGRPGTFAYHCTLHPGMTGSVVVRR
ncbi:cupredoxin domain-containing protein [Conexibacter woesei]|uniref:Blue (Type 1) copper domain protein n=1 Tax=Conexibacter woesei (strain DSM 14684 / CCUG 47730 / CIP 108061 / JCM 11494 / NBRC 100937 / ID131577) TaxID=469383 RepID=D3F504_CONWI|nr:plastocyanin/azurin family copper-binding protein [Conexibacter woesei]ADB48582.1 blue (type 1) copper domain protein [Conexibacter woesei DSM 14684]